MSLQSISQRIHHIRTEVLHLPQQDFAQRMGMKQNNMSGIEKGQWLPSCFFLWALHTTYQINLHWLLTGEGEPMCQSNDSPT
ncbi:helix-turn-helix domain-containing protein [Xanthocytophaga flava]|uniref:helix-turn-helix domain-containing protein n=1 Tax=Xanthocytophaga flava TaxID=3048013 RepID=UPI0028D09DF5|nr:helix-turn-helix transcriptional regulator [Xanthocytophaga flavus]MDJ1467282.1 helix-turn-helix transcriptional regulator [Xanthocytophaga flavus]